MDNFLGIQWIFTGALVGDEEGAVVKKYIVQDGDTMERISAVTGVRMSLLQSANPQWLSGALLTPGAVVSVPDLHKPAAPVEPWQVHSDPAREVPAGDVGQADTTRKTEVPGFFGLVWPHVVRNNETWASVADTYQIPTLDLQRMNAGRATRPLQPGDILYVPNVVTPMQPNSFVAQAAQYPQPTTTDPQNGNWPAPDPRQYPWPSALPWPAYPTPAQQATLGPYAAFPGGAGPLSAQAVDALWRRASAAAQGMQDWDDESSSLESSWSDAPDWGRPDPDAH